MTNEVTTPAEKGRTAQFADEEVSSSYSYPSGYKKPKDIGEQLEYLADLFDFNPRHAHGLSKNLPPISTGAEGWFTIPKWERVASTYNEAVKKILSAICQTRRGKFSCGDTPINSLSQTPKTYHSLELIATAQRGDFLIFPAQFGLRHRGRSSRRASEVMSISEFDLGVFAVGVMLLTHPERLQGKQILGINSAGDGCYHCGSNNEKAYFQTCEYGVLKLDVFWRSYASPSGGSASGFLPGE